MNSEARTQAIERINQRQQRLNKFVNITEAHVKREMARYRRCLLKAADNINAVIHRRNLYLVVPNQGNRRVINCHVVDGALVVQDLYSDELIPVAGNNFMDGYGHAAVLDDLGGAA